MYKPTIEYLLLQQINEGIFYFVLGFSKGLSKVRLPDRGLGIVLLGLKEYHTTLIWEAFSVTESTIMKLKHMYDPCRFPQEQQRELAEARSGQEMLSATSKHLLTEMFTVSPILCPSYYLGE